MKYAAYDVTRRETFESLDDIWMREVDMYSTVEDSVKMVVANKLDKVMLINISCSPTLFGWLSTVILLCTKLNMFLMAVCRSHKGK